MSTLTTEQKVNNVIKWHSALKSGEYKQRMFYLVKGGEYYYLGLACAVLHNKCKIDKEGCLVSENEYFCNIEFLSGYATQSYGLVGDVEDFVDTFIHKGTLCLTEFKDDYSATFPEIADFLVEYADKVFEIEVAGGIKQHFNKQ